MHNCKEYDESLKSFDRLRQSLAEEAQAFLDYKQRALESKDKTQSMLFDHLAREEAKHFSMILEVLVDISPEIDDNLSPVSYIGEDDLTMGD